MGEITGISWCDHTFNPWWGCTRVSPGCEHCYAETFDKRTGGDHWGPNKPRRRFGDKHWTEPLKWNKVALRDGVKRKVFCASMADVLDKDAPTDDRTKLWKLIISTPDLIWLLLTKRPENWWLVPNHILEAPNVWKGCTTENQKWFDHRWPYMAALPGIRFISYEPALGRLVLPSDSHPDWVICGGESGPKHRHMEEWWATDLLQQCRTLKMAFFMKQMSAATPAKGKDLIPQNLNVQEFPRW